MDQDKARALLLALVTHTYIHTNSTYTHTYTQTQHTHIHTYIQTQHTHTHTHKLNIHTYIHTYKLNIHTHKLNIHTHIHTKSTYTYTQIQHTHTHTRHYYRDSIRFSHLANNPHDKEAAPPAPGRLTKKPLTNKLLYLRSLREYST